MAMGRAGGASWALVGLAALSAITHWDTVLALTRDPRGRQLITLLKAEMPAGRAGHEPTLDGAMGRRLFRDGLWPPGDG